MQTALVTGANGFIGSHLARHLLERGYQVRCLVRRTSDLSSLDGLPVSVCVGDVRQPESLVAPLQGVHYVFHLAAQLMALSREEFEGTNTRGTINMLEAIARNQSPDFKRFLLTSSQAAAGPGESAAALDESAPRRPISWYGISKSKAEDAVAQFAGSVPCTVVRPSSVYGAREKDLSQMYPLVDQRIQPKLGILEKKLVMVYVGDLVQGIVDAAESANTIGRVYFLNRNDVVSTAEAIRTIAQAMDRSSGLLIPVPVAAVQLVAPLAEYVSRFTRERPAMTRDKAREVSQRYWVATPAAAQRDFGWTAGHSLLDGMRLTTQAWRQSEAEIKAMPLEDALWPKYLTVASGLGAIIEITSHLGGFYTFQPAWLVFAVVFGAFGLVLGTLAMWLRSKSYLLQFAAGTVLAGAAEALNVAAFHAWTFRPGWPFGITNDWVRSAVLGLAGGIFVLVVNAIMVALYKRRLRLG